ncbi:MAG: DUF1612 domain-containing protein [Mesorhizobium sp.]|uniref:RHE_PE00001 family protein n=1 Tax=Mesorhizobium sp. TaxID=1871066 RepID=UPI000FE93711|nr:RHE_PE00001 family protein [Mesorhizobium sp.]RWI33319.1 MAG: DUF1612 domain-containing protein [Mesorhizobium sp.]RWI37051.1 MAG: DUF1612 domain-containing protein [Mesorhizobium sp.]RWI62645.1 MAG: DUF1612 domain-containing protein [Mesorhizobium sp.]RWI81468.1 MAG: DUF1612 domain-containing protein [Mesorhizobium sp.]RWJ42373.1 MAG: DUF1612 domain-containing protein [Mesorhizobium sp.]
MAEGFIERSHFFESAASMWVAGELVHVEDLVLHDAHMDIRTPTHELTIAHSILRARRRIATSEPDWALSDRGLATLSGSRQVEETSEVSVVRERAGEGEPRRSEEPAPLAAEFAHIDAVLERSDRLISTMLKGDTEAAPERRGLVVGDLMIRDPDWDEVDRLSQWRSVQHVVQDMPPVLAGALLFDAWEALDPVQRQHGLGGVMIGAYLRYRGKVTSHLPGFNVGLKVIGRERRRAKDRSIRLVAFLDAMSASADAGIKEIARLSQARVQMERRLLGRRSTSSLPAAIELILSRPVVSAGMIAKAARVTPRGALTLIADLGVREFTGRGRYRAWGVL